MKCLPLLSAMVLLTGVFSFASYIGKQGGEFQVNTYTNNDQSNSMLPPEATAVLSSPGKVTARMAPIGGYMPSGMIPTAPKPVQNSP